MTEQTKSPKQRAKEARKRLKKARAKLLEGMSPEDKDAYLKARYSFPREKWRQERLDKALVILGPFVHLAVSKSPYAPAQTVRHMRLTRKVLRVRLHPFATIFPALSSDAADRLVNDIRENTLHEPVTVDKDGWIVDGRNRALACVALGIPYKTVTTDLEGGALLRWVLSKNLHRRHLTTPQRAAVAATLANLKHGGDRSAHVANLQLAVTQAQAAKTMNVSKRSVSAAVKLREEAPDLLEEVKEGKVGLREAQDTLEERAGRSKWTLKRKQSKNSMSPLAVQLQKEFEREAELRALAQTVLTRSEWLDQATRLVLNGMEELKRAFEEFNGGKEGGTRG